MRHSIAFILLNLLVVIAFNANAAQKATPAKKINFAKDVDTLGGNKELMQMAESLNPEAQSRIVQNRIVERRNRLELGLNYGAVMGGDSYMRTQNLGVQADFHITPRWSIGARYYDYGNDLTPEGKRVFDEARENHRVGAVAGSPDIDYPLNSAMAILSWYPMYGKVNMFDSGIAQFDIYLLAGGGQITLSSGDTSLLTAGAGVGMWVTKHFTLRGEIRYQNYQDEIITGSRNIHATVGTLGFGWIL